MEITKLRIENFRSIKKLELPLSTTTILVGANNAGKTAILEALRIALGRRWGTRGTGFTEYDIHLPEDDSDPKQCGPAVIEIEFRERQQGEWPAAVQDDLISVIQPDADNRSVITLRVSCGWDEVKQAYEPTWAFLNAAREPMRGGQARVTNTHPLFQYAPIFYMSALRDSGDEFTSRSQFWGRLLKAVVVPEQVEARIKRVLDLVNTKILNSDPRLAEIAENLQTLTTVAASESDGDVQLRAVPFQTWDLLSRAEVIMRTDGNRPWLPLEKQGQGVQSLSVIFLFETFVRQLLDELYVEGSTPILALEEPEAHLHPQAARTLWEHIKDLPGQKLITTHSPYFVQSAPFRGIKVVRLGSDGTAVTGLDEEFTATPVPSTPELRAFVAARPGRYRHNVGSSELVVKGKIEEQERRDLLAMFGDHDNRVAITACLATCARESQLFVDDAKLLTLDEWARRVRGEIFFARKWLLVEGQSEYVLVQGLATLMGYDLNSHGVSIIDYRNNGSAGPFVALARALQIPWVALVDNDPQGESSKREIVNLGVDADTMAARVVQFDVGGLEDALLSAGHEAILRDILKNSLQYADADTVDDARIRVYLDNNKVDVAMRFADRMRADHNLAQNAPPRLRELVGKIRDLAA